jgi:N-acetyl-alpha-D-muramate 1-phosphate uridylyltransferase
MTLPVAILAGGLATRLGSVTKWIPKSLLDIWGRPFAEYQLDLLCRNNLKDVVFCVGHHGEQIEAALGDGSRFGLHISYSYDGHSLLGTGGALRRALPLLGEVFFVMYGDSYLGCNFGQIEEAFWASGKAALMTVYQNDNRWDKSNILFQNGRISVYDKTHLIQDMQHIDYGLGVFRSKVFAAYPADRSFDLASAYRELLSNNLLAAYEVRERFYEIGSPAGLEETRTFLRGKHKF